MANPFCLIPQYADQFIAKLRSGEWDANALARMTSAERRAAFADVMGDANAANVNASFESRLLLKNQQAGLERWVQNASDLSLPAKRDLLARVERMDKILDPATADRFLADLARQRLGFSVSMNEAGEITAMAQRVAKARQALEAGGDRMEYGRAKVAFGNYTSDLKNAAAPSLAKSAKSVLVRGQKPADRLAAMFDTGKQAVKEIPGFAKSFKAAFDNSALFRQGWKTLLTRPGVWQRNARQSFVDLVRQFGNKPVMDEVNAEIISRPNALNGRYHQAKLALAVVEDMYPSTLPERLPSVLGRAYRASQSAFTAFQYRTRADVFDKYMEIAERSGVDLRSPAELQSIGRMVNSLTARGHLGPVEPIADVLNVTFFSARKLKADIDFLTAHQFDSGVTPFVRKQAAINLAKAISGIAAILGVAKAVMPNSVDPDLRSADAGRIRAGNTRFDMTGGLAPIAVLAARLLTMSSKSSTTGKVNPINSGEFGATKGTDLVYNFFENKLSPAASVVKDILKGKDFAGNKPTMGGELRNLLVPLPISNAIELANDPEGANVLVGVMADALGIGTNTWERRPTRLRKPVF